MTDNKRAEPPAPDEHPVQGLSDALWSRVCEIAFSYMWSNTKALETLVERGLDCAGTGCGAEIERLRRDLDASRQERAELCRENDWLRQEHIKLRLERDELLAGVKVTG